MFNVVAPDDEGYHFLISSANTSNVTTTNPLIANQSNVTTTSNIKTDSSNHEKSIPSNKDKKIDQPSPIHNDNLNQQPLVHITRGVYQPPTAHHSVIRRSSQQDAWPILISPDSVLPPFSFVA